MFRLVTCFFVYAGDEAVDEMMVHKKFRSLAVWSADGNGMAWCLRWRKLPESLMAI